MKKLIPIITLFMMIITTGVVDARNSDNVIIQVFNIIDIARRNPLSTVKKELISKGFEHSSDKGNDYISGYIDGYEIELGYVDNELGVVEAWIKRPYNESAVRDIYTKFRAEFVKRFGESIKGKIYDTYDSYNVQNFNPDDRDALRVERKSASQGRAFFT